MWQVSKVKCWNIIVFVWGYFSGWVFWSVSGDWQRAKPAALCLEHKIMCPLRWKQKSATRKGKRQLTFKRHGKAKKTESIKHCIWDKWASLESSNFLVGEALCVLKLMQGPWKINTKIFEIALWANWSQLTAWIWFFFFPPFIFQSQLLLDERVQQEWLVCETINGHGFHRDHLNPSREEAGTLHVSHVTEPHYTHASACRSLSLSSVYYTGLRGEIDLKWQLLGPNSRRAALTRMQQHQSHLPEVKTRVYHGHHPHVRFIWHLIGFIFGKRKDFCWECERRMTTSTCLTIKPVVLII